MTKVDRDTYAEKCADKVKCAMQLIGKWDDTIAQAIVLETIENVLIRDHEERKKENKVLRVGG